MVYNCCVPGCGNDSGCKKNLSLHKFPLENKALVQQWLKVLGRKDWYPSKYARVCGDHFIESDYTSESSRRLKPNAVPSRLLLVAKDCFCKENDEDTTKMTVSCIVRGCTSVKENGNGINFFRFPNKPQQREQWLKILNIPNLESPNNSYVCSGHFEQKYFVTNNGNQILLPGAVPTKLSNNTNSRITRKLVPIRPKPSIFPTNQNIVIQSLPIVVVPVQKSNTLIPTSTIDLKTQINQNLQKLQMHVPKINQTENNEFPASIPISETIVEINNFDEDNNSNDSEETESVVSINSVNETQNSPKLDESCYVLVEVNDKIDGNLNEQDDGEIVASGFDIKELINDAKIAINNRPVQTPDQRRVRRWRTNYIGDCVFEDMENPEIRKHHWTLALNEIQKLRRKVKNLEQKTRRLQKRLNNAKTTISQLKQNDNDDNNVQMESDDSY